MGKIEQAYGVLDHMPTGVCLLRKDFVVLFWNHILQEWTGISKETILGHPIGEFFSHFKNPKYTTRLLPIFEGAPPTIFSPQLHPHYEFNIPLSELSLRNRMANGMH